jgi:transcriptional regulator with XRE-family HTH domain
MNLGERIRNIRESKGLSQKEVSEKIGCSYQQLAQWEKGLRNPTYRNIEKIANALDTSTLLLTGFDLCNISTKDLLNELKRRGVTNG